MQTAIREYYDIPPLDAERIGRVNQICHHSNLLVSLSCSLFFSFAPLFPLSLLPIPSGGGKQLSNPCREITCDFGSVCVERIRGSNLGSNVIVPECSCPDKCSRYFQEVDLDSDGKQSSSASNNMTHSQLDIRLWMSGQSEDTPVCGSDGSDYSSLCQLKSTSCSEKRHITARFIGKCGKLYLAFISISHSLPFPCQLTLEFHLSVSPGWNRFPSTLSCHSCHQI